MHAFQKWKRGTMREVSEEKSLGPGLSFFPRKTLLFFFFLKFWLSVNAVLKF